MAERGLWWIAGFMIGMSVGLSYGATLMRFPERIRSAHYHGTMRNALGSMRIGAYILGALLLGHLLHVLGWI